MATALTRRLQVLETQAQTLFDALDAGDLHAPQLGQQLLEALDQLDVAMSTYGVKGLSMLVKSDSIGDQELVAKRLEGLDEELRQKEKARSEVHTSLETLEGLLKSGNKQA